jgi:hypothetical protein
MTAYLIVTLVIFGLAIIADIKQLIGEREPTHPRLLAASILTTIGLFTWAAFLLAL